MSGARNLHRHRFTAMGGPCELQLHAPDESAARAGFAAGEAEVRRLEQKYSRFRDDSTTSAINRSAGRERFTPDAETAALLDYAATAFEQSGGLFDLTAGALRRAWDFKARRIPSQAEIDAVLAHVGWARVSWRDGVLALPERMELDFGGVVKEYAADCAARAMREAGYAHGLADLGGDIALVGAHPDGSPWQVGVSHPRAPERAIASIELATGAIATSGDYERYFENAGKRYSHILDPRTGWPATGLASVSVVAAQCLVAGTASTVAMLKGAIEGPAWLEALGLPWLVADAAGTTSGTLAH